MLSVCGLWRKCLALNDHQNLAIWRGWQHKPVQERGRITGSLTRTHWFDPKGKDHGETLPELTLEFLLDCADHLRKVDPVKYEEVYGVELMRVVTEDNERTPEDQRLFVDATVGQRLYALKKACDL